MPEFIPTLIAGLVMLVVLYAAVGLSQAGITGAFIGKPSPSDSRQFAMLAEKEWVSSYIYPLANSSTQVEKGIGAEAGWILPFTAIPSRYEAGVLEFTVKEHSDSELIFSLNGHEVYRGKPEAGRQWVEFPLEWLDADNVLEAKTDSWQFWANSKYGFSATISGEVISTISQQFVAPKSWKRAKLLISFTSSSGKIIIRQDGKEIWKGAPDGSLSIELELGKGRAHSIELRAEPRARHYIDYAAVVFER